MEFTPDVVAKLLKAGQEYREAAFRYKKMWEDTLAKLQELQRAKAVDGVEAQVEAVQKDEEMVPSSKVQVPLEELFVGMVVKGTVSSKGSKGIFIDVGSVKDALLSAPRRVRCSLTHGQKLDNCSVVSIDLERRHLKVSVSDEDAGSADLHLEDWQKMQICQYFQEQDNRQAWSGRVVLAPAVLPAKLPAGDEEISAEKTAVAALTNLVADLKAFQEKLKEAASMPSLRSEELDAEGSDLASLVRRFQEQILHCGAVLPVLERGQKAKEVLTHALCCPLSHGIVSKPLFAPDGFVYEEKLILEWLELHPVSPLTNKSMRPDQLLRAPVVEKATEALWLLLGDERHQEREALKLIQLPTG